MLKARIRVLPGFDLEVEFTLDHELLAMLGPSGSGKTMTLQCIAGLIKPDEGHIELNGKVLFDSRLALICPPRSARWALFFRTMPFSLT